MYYSFAEGAVVAYFMVPPHNFIAGKKGDREKNSNGRLCPGWDSNQVLPESWWQE